MGFVPLKPLVPKDNRKPLQYSVCDIESFKGWINFAVIGLCWEGRYEYFENLAEFCQFIFEDEHPNDTIFAHFGGRYDFSFILREFLQELYPNYQISDIIPRGSGILCFTVTKLERTQEPKGKTVVKEQPGGWFLVEGRKIVFRDSSGFLPAGLGSLTENFNVDHKKGEIDYDSITKITPELLEYLESDCKGLFEVIKAYLDWPMIKEAGPAFTIASQALRVFRTFLVNPIPSLDDEVDHFVRESYFGGRTEIFKPFFQECSQTPFMMSYDVNSLYPFVMRELEFPTRFSKFTKLYLENRMGFYDVEVTVPEMYVPPLGTRHEDLDNRLIFPTGTFRGIWSTLELQYAESLGVKINKVFKGALFESGGKIFEEYIDYLYDLRKKSKKNSVDNILCKLLMNSTYGRFGLNLDREQLTFEEDPEASVFMEIPLKNHTNVFFRLSKKQVELDSSFSNVAVTAWVTSGARVHMHKQILHSPEDMYYMDSVTEERMVAVRSKNKKIWVESVGSLWIKATDKKTKGSKETGQLPYETLSYNFTVNEWEWRKIEKIIRHETNKKIVLTRSNKGASRTTEDHSFINSEGLKVKPSEIEELFSPKSQKIPKGVVLNEIDLLDYIGDLSGLAWNDNWIWATHENSKRRKDYKEILFKRKFSGKALKEFCSLAGYYVAEGSASLAGSRSISSEKYEYQEKLMEFLNRSLGNTKIIHIKSSEKDNCTALRSGTKTMAIIFSRLFGQGSANKRLPDFVFNLNEECEAALWEGLILGDGSRTTNRAYSEDYRNTEFSYSSQSFILINQLCLLLLYQGRCYSIQFREDKKLWTIQTSRKNRSKRPSVKNSLYSGAVFDLQVEGNNNFFDCEGMIGLHNTDSLKTTHKYERNDDDLGKLKLEYKARQACYLLPKTYMEDTTEPVFNLYNEAGKLIKDLFTSKKLVMKGFDKKKISHFTMDDFTSALEGDLRRLKAMNPKKFAPLATAMKKSQFLALLNEQERRIRSRYSKRRIFKRAYKQVYDTEPLHIKGGKIINIDPDILKKWKPPSDEELKDMVLYQYQELMKKNRAVRMRE